jgi:hypothetical protein
MTAREIGDRWACRCLNVDKIRVGRQLTRLVLPCVLEPRLRLLDTVTTGRLFSQPATGAQRVVLV